MLTHRYAQVPIAIELLAFTFFSRYVLLLSLLF